MSEPSRAALVTGAASGIGAAIVDMLATDGVRVFALDLDVAARRATTGHVVPLVADVTDLDAVNAVVGTIANLDVVVNAAGIARDVAPDGDLDILRRVLDVNAVGALLVTRAALPALRRSLSPRVLNIGSIQADHSGAASIAYSSSKAALHAMTRALAVDLASDGILVNALAPGFVTTAMSVLPDGRTEFETPWFQQVYVEHGRIPLRRPADPAEIAAAADFLISARNTYVTGAILTVDGGMTATF